MSTFYKFWLRQPRIGWRYNGGPIPYRLRGRMKHIGIKRRTLVIKKTGGVVRKGHWVVSVGNQLFAFSPSDMRRLYSRVPL